MAKCGEELPFISAEWYAGTGLALNENGACSGNGICNNVTGLCECFPGWTGRSDLINTEGIDCQINDIAVRVEWGLIILLACIFMFQTRDRVVDRIRQHFETKKQRASSGKRYTIWRNNRTLIAMVCYSFGCFPSIVLLGIVRIADANERAGVTFAYSILFFTGKLFFYLAVLVFQPALLSSLLTGGKKGNQLGVQRLIRLGYITQYVTFVFSMVAAVAPLIIIADSGTGVTELAQIVYIAYFALQVASMIILCVVSNIIKSRAANIFKASYLLTNDKRTKDLGLKVDTLEKKAVISSFIIGVIYFAYLIFPTLWNKHDYVFPLTWIPFIVIGRDVNRQHVKTSGSSSKNSGGSSSYSNDEEGDSKSNNRSFRTMLKFGKAKGAGDSNYITPGGAKQEEQEKSYVSNLDGEEDDGYV